MFFVFHFTHLHPDQPPHKHTHTRGGGRERDRQTDIHAHTHVHTLPKHRLQQLCHLILSLMPHGGTCINHWRVFCFLSAMFPWTRWSHFILRKVELIRKVVMSDLIVASSPIEHHVLSEEHRVIGWPDKQPTRNVFMCMRTS